MTRTYFTAAAAVGLLFASAAKAQIADEAPRPPLNAAPGRVLPARDAAGLFETPNRQISPVAAAWHVRAALNVAALMCRDLAPEATVAAYNAMLATERDALAADNLALLAEYRARYGAGWQARYDTEMTRLYGFFAEPGAYRPFCAAAREALAAVAAVPPDGFNTFAAGVLGKLEAPITDFYADYDRYLTHLAAWRVAHGPAAAPVVVLATSAPAAVTVTTALAQAPDPTALPRAANGPAVSEPAPSAPTADGAAAASAAAVIPD